MTMLLEYERNSNNFVVQAGEAASVLLLRIVYSEAY